MRRGILIAETTAGPKILAGPLPYREIHSRFRELIRRGPIDPETRLLEIWSSDGVTRRHRLRHQPTAGQPKKKAKK